jgi:hypothetical protein
MGNRGSKTIIEQATDYLEAAYDAAVDKAGPVLSDAVDKAGPMLSDAKDKAGQAFVDVRDEATPLLVAGAAKAAEQAAAAADLASEKASELQAEIESHGKKRHTFRNILMVVGIAALLGFVAKKLSSRGQQDNWQAAYTPPPPPSGRPASSDGASDAAGAGPGEAIADAVDEPHSATTPDAPVEVVDVDDKS